MKKKSSAVLYEEYERILEEISLNRADIDVLPLDRKSEQAKKRYEEALAREESEARD